MKSPFTLGHSRGVAEFAAAAAAMLGLPSGDVGLVRRAALVHDVGATGVSSGILDKPGRLTEVERERIRTHPYLTTRTFSKPSALATIGQLAGMHHERMDGSGYPSGLTADGIPMTARVIAAADVFDALLEPRPHRRPGGAGRSGTSDARASGPRPGGSAPARSRCWCCSVAG